MVCVYCGGRAEVINSRPNRKDNRVWRRRHCVACGAVFSTRETVEYDLSWRVRKRGRLRPFSRDKLFMSLYDSCKHRETALSDAEGLTDTVIIKLRAFTGNGVADSRDIVQVALVALNRFDKAAGVHYGAHHKS
ncbi:MAG TPA: hypothetical protein VFX84_01825 [Candidatus Saccharimonadales bacterium]|nr:hypothetical protein [Candidatus Saccharimonadales bacterium]